IKSIQGNSEFKVEIIGLSNPGSRRHVTRCWMIQSDHFHDALSPDVSTGAQMSEDVIGRPGVLVRPEMQFAHSEASTQRCDAPRGCCERSLNFLGLFG